MRQRGADVANHCGERPGIPGTPPMPAWLKGAYTKVESYGMPLGSIPPGMTVPVILTADEI